MGSQEEGGGEDDEHCQTPHGLEKTLTHRARDGCRDRKRLPKEMQRKWGFCCSCFYMVVR